MVMVYKIVPDDMRLAFPLLIQAITTVASKYLAKATSTATYREQYNFVSALTTSGERAKNHMVLPKL